MSQHDYNIADQPGASFLADLNAALAAIVSQNAGVTEPSPTYAYQWWADTTSGKLKLRNGSNTAWVDVGSLSNPNLGLALAGAITASGLTQSTGKLLGRTSAGSGAIEEISAGTGLTLASGVLNAIIASTAEAQAGTDNTKLMTPARLADAFKGANQSLSGNGYQRLPGGLILQWGRAVVPSPNTLTTYSFPIAFQTACQQFVCSAMNNGTVLAPVQGLAISTTQYQLVVSTPNETAAWIAIGN